MWTAFQISVIFIWGFNWFTDCMSSLASRDLVVQWSLSLTLLNALASLFWISCKVCRSPLEDSVSDTQILVSLLIYKLLDILPNIPCRLKQLGVT